MAIQVHGEPQVEGNKGYVTIEGDSPHAVNDTKAKAMALQVMQGRLNSPGISEQTGHYPVDPDTGLPYAEWNAGLKPGTKFRQDFVVQGGI